MIDPSEMQLVPEKDAKPERVFDKAEDYDEFCRKFIQEVGPELEKQREARQRSEADAKQRWTR